MFFERGIMSKQKNYSTDIKKETSMHISMKEVRRGVRLPLPVQTGGRHKDVRRVSRQEQKVALRRHVD